MSRLFSHRSHYEDEGAHEPDRMAEVNAQLDALTLQEISQMSLDQFEQSVTLGVCGWRGDVRLANMCARNWNFWEGIPGET